MCAMSFTVDHGSDGYIATKQQKQCVKKMRRNIKSYLSKKSTNKHTTSSPYSILVYNKL